MGGARAAALKECAHCASLVSFATSTRSSTRLEDMEPRREPVGALSVSMDQSAHNVWLIKKNTRPILSYFARSTKLPCWSRVSVPNAQSSWLGGLARWLLK